MAGNYFHHSGPIGHHCKAPSPLADSRFAEKRHSFTSFLAGFGITDIGELTGEQLLMFVAARNSMQHMAALNIPHGRDSSDSVARLSRDSSSQEPIIPSALLEYSSLAAGHGQDVAAVKRLEEIRFCIDEDLLLQMVEPDEFMRRLAEGELRRRSWPRAEQEDPAPSPAPQMEPSQTAAPEFQYGSYGVVMLDGSESMASSRDLRKVVSRGSALAFLYAQHLVGNPAVVRIFDSKLGPPYGGSSTEEFQDAVAAVILHENERRLTKLQSCLRTLAEELEKNPHRSDVLLVTDAIAVLRDKPFSRIHLHTLCVGETTLADDLFAEKLHITAIRTLTDWSDTMLRSTTEQMERVCIPQLEDLKSLIDNLEGINEETKEALVEARVIRIGQRVRNIRELYERYRQSAPESEDQELNDMESSICAAEAFMSSVDAAACVDCNRSTMNPHLAQSLAELQQRVLEGPLDESRITASQNSRSGEGNLNLTLGVLLRMIWRSIRDSFSQASTFRR